MTNVNDLLQRLKKADGSGSPSTENRNIDVDLSFPHSQASPVSFGTDNPVSPSRKPTQQAATTSMSFDPFSSGGAHERSTSDKTANLLNLLKFGQPTSSSPGPQSPQVKRESSEDQTNSAFSNPYLAAQSNTAKAISPAPTPAQAAPQDVLLNLLKRSESSGPSHSSERVQSPSAVAGNAQIKTDDNERRTRESSPLNGARPGADKFSFTVPKPSGQSTIFGYKNPFDELSASSPLNLTPLSERTGNNVPSDPVAKIASPVPSPLGDGRTRTEALVGIGAQREPEKSIVEALGEVAEKADQQAQDALARASDAATPHEGATSTERALKVVKKEVHEAAVEMNEKLKDKDTRAEFEKGLPRGVAKAFESTVKEIAGEQVVDSWESADADESGGKDEDGVAVRVYNFPMKPFVSLDIKSFPPPIAAARQDVIMKIASLKREFDQLDRTLATATSNLIVYAMNKGGGYRVIRQDDGQNKAVFKDANNRIFNISIRNDPASGSESVLATAANGSVFWTSVPTDKDAFEATELEQIGFIFPPQPSQDENTSGAQLKTRAKQSSRHPEFFAIGRGKSIHIIKPSVALRYINKETRVVDSERYLAEQCLKIATGKAGKDFTFSEDDTVIASLDKAGRLKFWDVREHIENEKTHVETKTPIMTMLTSPATDKSWATSVQFIDKERPIAKAVALRYLLVGLKQNHTIQLWDLSLGKPVQELNFPHENETDAICSIAYHPKSAIITVGHPTRNSVYLIHLSAPKYNLPSMTQATLIRRLVENDKTLPRPDSTAIMSGIREISLSSVGQLRSLDILDPVPPTVSPNPDEETVFEIYTVHSRGVTCLTLKRQDLGWGPDGKVLKSYDAAALGVISVKELAVVNPPETSSNRISQAELSNDWRTKEPTSNGNLTSPTKASAPAKADAPTAEKAGANTSRELTEPVKEGTKKDKKKEKKAAAQAEDPPAPAPPAPESYASALKGKTESQGKSTLKPTEQLTLPAIASNDEFASVLSNTISSALGTTLRDVFGSVLGDQMSGLYARIEEDKRIQEAAGAAKQEAILKLVSSTLTDNVEKSLARIVNASIQEKVMPSLGESASKAINRELKGMLNGAIQKALTSPEVLKSISEVLSTQVKTHIETTITTAFKEHVIPSFKTTSAEAARKAFKELEKHAQNNQSSTRFDKLEQMNEELLGVVRALSADQSALRNEIITLQTQLAKQETTSLQTPYNTIEREPSAPQRDEELETIMELMATGRLEEGTIKWLSSERQMEIFDKFFAQYDPIFLASVNSIVTLSVVAVVSSTFDSHVSARLRWLETALEVVNIRDVDVAEVGPNMMDVLTNRLQAAYMEIAAVNHIDAVLPKFHILVRKARELKAVA